MVEHAFNPRTLQAETSVRSRLAWAVQRVPGQPDKVRLCLEVKQTHKNCPEFGCVSEEKGFLRARSGSGEIFQQLGSRIHPEISIYCWQPGFPCFP